MQIDDKYRIDDKIGSGGFSEVFLATDLSTGQKVAIKKVSLLQKSLQKTNVLNKLSAEIELMKKLDHPNIVSYYDTIKTNVDWYIVMEYCNAGTLEDVIKFNESMGQKKDISFNREANTYYYLNQVKDALNYVRSQGYIHRDIKPMNILITQKELLNQSLVDSYTMFKSDEQINQNIKDNLDCSQKLTVKLADFGLAKHYMDCDDMLSNTICGSPLYMAPELILNKKYNSKADLWSYGIIMYQMLFGINPNTATDFQQLVKNLRSKEIDFHLNKNFTTECFDLLTKLLAKDPNMRIDWSNLFKHKWFTRWENAPTGDVIVNVNKTIPIQIPESKPSSLGHSNLSKMKWNEEWFKGMKFGSYSKFPSSYPPESSQPIPIILKKSQAEIITPNNSIGDKFPFDMSSYVLTDYKDDSPKQVKVLNKPCELSYINSPISYIDKIDSVFDINKI